MALFFSEKNAKKHAKPTASLTLQIESLDYQGLGVAKHQGKTYFVENALPNETVEARIIENKARYALAKSIKILQQSDARQIPFCPHYGQCGGCQMQHAPLALQRENKQQALFQRLQRLQSDSIQIMPMIIGQDHSYRRRARLSIAYQNNRLQIGFRQSGSERIVPLQECAVLSPALSALLLPLQDFFASWQPKKLGHIELVEADNGVVMLLRHLGHLSTQDGENLRHFATKQSLTLYLMNDQGKIELVCGDAPFYYLNNLALHFSVRDFIQVNRELNEKMVNTALQWLDLQPSDRVLDLFCGMGNFTLPIATQAHSAVGVEGVAEMVIQAKQNAAINGLNNVEFYRTDLDQPFADKPWAALPFNKVLLDPARGGAFFVLDHLCDLAPEKIVYISCNPATLVRDAEKLIARGYCLTQYAIIDMFPHTSHLESISLFEQQN